MRRPAVTPRYDLQEHVARAHTNLATFAIGNRDYRAANPHLKAGLAFCAEYELYMAAAYMRAFQARMHFEQGAWTRAIGEAEELLRIRKRNFWRLRDR